MALTDNDPFPFGMHAGTKMANVPASYLLWLYDNSKCYGEVKEYIKDNYWVLKKEKDQNIKTRQ